MARQHHGDRGNGGRVLGGIGEFADIAGPAVGFEAGHRLRRECEFAGSSSATEKVGGEGGNILRSLNERRQRDLKYTDLVIEIFTEPSSLHVIDQWSHTCG